MHQQEEDQLAQLIDGEGNTQGLLDAIAMNNGQSVQLKDLLLNNWPLSDTVLAAYSLKTGVPATHYRK